MMTLRLQESDSNMKLVRLLIVCSFSLWSLSSFALPRESRVPGGIAIVAVPGGVQAPAVTFKERPVAVLKQDKGWQAIVGIPLDTLPGSQVLKVVTGDKLIDVPFRVGEKSYRTHYLTIKNERQVSPNPDDLMRITSEQQRSEAALASFTQADLPLALA